MLRAAQLASWLCWTPNRVTALRVATGLGAVALFGRGTWANFAAVLLTVAAVSLDALDGHLARKKNLATPSAPSSIFSATA